MKLVATLLAVLASSACLDLADDESHEHDDALFEQAHEENQLEPKADSTDCSGVRVPDRSGFRKRIALTFDDGPNPATTPKIIEVLKAHNAPAAFFNNGSKYGTQAAKDLAAQIAADDQFILANHSQNHKDLAKQSPATVKAEMVNTELLIKEAGGEPTYFRFPYGSSTCTTMEAAHDRGYIVTGWHIDSADWCYAGGGGTCKKSTFKYVPDAMRGSMMTYVLTQARSTGGGIILFHDIHANTANQLDAILTALEADGFSFVRLDDDTVFPRLHGRPPST
jgi:peptidoglycan-N-acetylglucosamine deacetylase